MAGKTANAGGKAGKSVREAEASKCTRPMIYYSFQASSRDPLNRTRPSFQPQVAGTKNTIVVYYASSLVAACFFCVVVVGVLLSVDDVFTSVSTGLVTDFEFPSGFACLNANIAPRIGNHNDPLLNFTLDRGCGENKGIVVGSVEEWILNNRTGSTQCVSLIGLGDPAEFERPNEADQVILDGLRNAISASCFLFNTKGLGSVECCFVEKPCALLLPPCCHCMWKGEFKSLYSNPTGFLIGFKHA